MNEFVNISVDDINIIIRVKEFDGETDSLFNCFKLESSLGEGETDGKFDGFKEASDNEADNIHIKDLKSDTKTVSGEEEILAPIKSISCRRRR